MCLSDLGRHNYLPNTDDLIAQHSRTGPDPHWLMVTDGPDFFWPLVGGRQPKAPPPFPRYFFGVRKCGVWEEPLINIAKAKQDTPLCSIEITSRCFDAK